MESNRYNKKNHGITPANFTPSLSEHIEMFNSCSATNSKMHLRSIHFRSDRSPSPWPSASDRTRSRNRTRKSLPKREPVCPCPVCSSSKIENSPPNDIDFGSTVRTDRPTVPMGCITLGHYCNCCTPGLPAVPVPSVAAAIFHALI